VVVFVAVVACISIFSAVKFSEYRKQQQQTALRLDSLERSLLRWELYSENLRRTLEGRPAVDIDSLICSNNMDEYEQKSRD